MTRSRSGYVIAGAVLVALVSGGFLAYLLYAFPYNGLYGVDAYAYAGQSDALFRELSGQPPRPGALFTAQGFAHWPIGYHLHLIAGRLLAGEGIVGGRLITLALTALVPALTFLLVARIAPLTSLPARLAAGGVAAVALLVTPAFTRTGTSLMSDVPAMFWALLSSAILVWRWPPRGVEPGGRPEIWAALAGGALGIAVLVRYPEALVVVPLAVYLFVRAWRPGSKGAGARNVPRALLGPVVAAALAFGVALTPQALYLRTHDPGPQAREYFATSTPANIFSRSSTGPDGREDFAHTMLEFYALSPVLDGPGGFLPLAFLPLVIAGAAVLTVRRAWALLAMLGTWWLLPALAYATTPYQVHRFALTYLPAIVALIGIGTVGAVERVAPGRLTPAGRKRALFAVPAVIVVMLLATGGVEGFRNVRSWQATHAAWQRADEALATSVLASTGPAGRALCLPSCFSVDYYARIPVLDLYNNGETALAAFISPGSTAVAVDERGLATQWVGTPVERRWEWLAATYNLRPAATSGAFTIYRIESP